MQDITYILFYIPYKCVNPSRCTVLNLWQHFITEALICRIFIILIPIVCSVKIRPKYLPVTMTVLLVVIGRSRA